MVEGETSKKVREGGGGGGENRVGKGRVAQGALPSARSGLGETDGEGAGGVGGVAAPRLAFQADSVNRVHYFLVISFYNSGLLS